MRKVLLIIALVMMILLSSYGCASRKGDVTQPGQFSITYIYDEVHQVCIWHAKNGYGEAIAVLPAKDVTNPELPPSWKN